MHLDTIKTEMKILGTMANGDYTDNKPFKSFFNKDHFTNAKIADACKMIFDGKAVDSHFQEFVDLGFNNDKLIKCMEMSESSSWIKIGLSHLEEMSLRRSAIEEAEATKKKALDPDVIFASSGRAESIINGLISYRDMRKAVGDGSPFGYAVLDYVLSGFRPSEVFGIVGLSGHGKTNVGINLYDNFLRTNGAPNGAYFSYEMNDTDLLPKILQMITGMSRKEVKNMVDFDFDRATNILTASHWQNVKFYYEPMDIKEMQSEIQKHNSPIAIIDHVGLMDGDSDEYKRPDLIKRIANKTGCRFLALYQVDKAAGREHVQKDGTIFTKRPRIIDAMGGSRVRASLNHGICVFKEKNGDIVAYFDKTRELEDYNAIKCTKYDMLVDMDWEHNQMRDLILLDEVD